MLIDERETKMNFALLSSIVSATASAGYMFVAPDTDAQELQNAELIEVNFTAPGQGADAGKFAARSTEKGNGVVANGGQFQPAAQTNPFAAQTQPTAQIQSFAPGAKAVSNFERVRQVLPASKPRAPSTLSTDEKYPFGKLEPINAAGEADMIFVAPTDKIPDPAKSLVSAVSAANRRYAIVLGVKTTKAGKERNEYEFVREFQLFPSTDKARPGAWIARVDNGSHPFANQLPDYDDNAVKQYIASKQPQA